MVRILSIIIFFTIGLQEVFSQDNTERPKIGLVLSGGGAKGLAHIGIIRALEKAGLTPDYVTGTSMGSIVGGLYAIGYNSDDIEKIVADTDWDALLSNKIPLNEITFEEKNYYGRYIAELPVDGIKVSLPRGLIEGQQLSELLSRLTRTAHEIEDFNNLSIPFACVAADIATGEPVILNKGSLPESIRASMAIPTVFTPVELNGRLLVDGGLVRNFPVEEAKAMGADIIIGVFVSSEFNTKEELNNLISVLTQSAFVTSVIDSRRQKEMVDIYIQPDLKEFSPGSFNHWEKIIQRGNEAGDKFVDTFKELADSLSALGPLNTSKVLVKKDEYLITEITIVGNKKIPSKLIKGKMRVQEGSVLSMDEIEKQISIIYGTGYFDKVEYEIIRNGAKYELKIKVTEAPDGFLKMSVHYDSENDIGINANLTYRNLLFNYSRALLEFDFSKNPRLDINYLKYIGEKQNAAIVFGFDASDNELSYYENGIEISRFDADNSDLYFQIQSTSFQNFTFGGKFQIDYSELNPIVGELGRVVERIRNRAVGVRLFTEYNSFNRQFFPTKGFYFSASIKRVFDVKNKVTQISEDSLSSVRTTVEQNLEPYTAAETSLTYIFQIAKRFSIITKNEMMLSTLGEPDLNITDFYFIGGFNPRFRNVTEFWGANEKEYISPNYFYTKLILQYEPFHNLFLSGIFNYIDVQYPMEIIYPIAVDNYLGGEKRRLGYGFSLGYSSPLGPISYSMAWDSKLSTTHTNINIGFWF